MARAKGTALIPLVSLLRARRERASAILSPELRGYLDQGVLAASWYPEAHLLALLRAGAEVVGGDRRQILREFGRGTARHHLEGVYAHLRLEDDPLAFPRRTFALWASQHDSGRLRLALEGEGVAKLRLEGYDSPSEEMCLVTWGYTEEVFTHSGRKDPQVVKRSCCNEGADVCEWQVRWEEPGVA